MLIFLSMIDSEQEQSEFERIYRRYEETVFRKTLAVLRSFSKIQIGRVSAQTLKDYRYMLMN